MTVFLILMMASAALGGQVGYDPPPPIGELARMARYIVHQSDWATIATISTQEGIESYPFAKADSISDGASVANSSGIPFMYVTPMGMTEKNIAKDNRVSITMTLAQGEYCTDNGLDTEDPRCGRVILTGKMVKVEKGSVDEAFARDALFTRHPVMEYYPTDFYFTKLNIEKITILDNFGPSKVVSIDDYFAASPY